MIHGRSMVPISDRELLRDIYNEGKPIDGMTGLEFVKKLEKLIFDDEERSRKFNMEVEKEEGGVYEYQNPSYGALLKDPSIAFIEFVNRETHFEALRLGFQWSDKMQGFADMTEDQYRQIRRDVLAALVRYTADFLKRKSQPDDSFLTSLEPWIVREE
jgi:hypothetical protein